MSRRGPKREILEQFCALAGQVRRGTYTVHRGPINLATWAWDTNPRAFSVDADETSLLEDPGDGSFSFELFVKTKPGATEFDYALQEELERDAAAVLGAVQRVKNDSGDDVVVGFSADSARVRPEHDPDEGIQGIFVTFRASY